MSSTTRFLTAILALLVLLTMLPIVPAAAPANVFSAPANTHTQVSSVASDAAGRYGLAAVDVNPTSVPGVSTSPDLFAYSFASGTEQWHASHPFSATPPNYRDATLTYRQVVAATAGDCSGCPNFFAVGGPSGTVSRWNANVAVADWEIKANNNGHVDAIAISNDGSRVFAGENLVTNGTLHVYNGANHGSELWQLSSFDAAGDTIQPVINTIAVSRTGGVGLVGTQKGIFRFNPMETTKPTAEELKDVFVNDVGPVTSIAMSRDGAYAVVGTDAGLVYFFRSQDLVHNAPKAWGRSCGSTATGDGISEVAIALDGSRFAAGSKKGTLCVYDRLDSDSIAVEHYTDSIHAGNSLAGIAMSGDGSIVVVGVDAFVSAYHIKRALPIWKVDLALDEGLAGDSVQAVSMSDDGSLVFVGTGSNTNTASATGHAFALKAKYALGTTVEGGLAQTAAPGTVVQFFLDLTNKGSMPDTYSFQVNRPADFTGALPSPVSLLPEESVRVPVNISIAPGHPPGPSTTEVKVVSTALASLGPCVNPATTACNPLADLKLNLTVARISNVRLESDEKSLSLNAGQELTFPFNIRNTGNAPAQVNLSATQFPAHGASWRIRFDNDRVSVQPNQVVQATAFIAAPASAADGDADEIHFRGDVGPAFVAEFVLTARVNPQFKLDLVANTTSLSVVQGRSAFVKITLTNRGNTDDVVNASFLVLPASARLDWRVTLDFTDNILLAKGSARSLTLTVKPISQTAADATVTVAAVSQGSAESQKVTISMTETAPPAPPSGFLPGPPFALVLAATALAASLVAARRRGR